MLREDAKALEIFEDSVQLVNGHYTIAVPRRNSAIHLPNNKSMAVHRLQSLRNKLNNNPELGQKYSAFMDDLLDKGYARKVPEDEIDLTGFGICRITT